MSQNGLTVCSGCGGANYQCGCWTTLTTVTGSSAMDTGSVVWYQGGMGTATASALQQPVSYKSYEELEYDRLTRLENWMNDHRYGIEVRLGKPHYYNPVRRLFARPRRHWVVCVHPYPEATISEAEAILKKRLDGNWLVVATEDRSAGPGTRGWYFYLEPIREN